MYKTGDSVIGKATLKEGRTTPPKLFSDGDLIDIMRNITAYVKIDDEEARKRLSGSGIGTARTREGIISGLFEKGLIKLKETTGRRKSKIVIPTDKGLELYEILRNNAQQLTNPLLTAQWESALTMIETGSVTQEQFLAKQRVFQETIINNIKANIKEVSSREKIEPLEGHGEICDKCGVGRMMTRVAKSDKTKRFLACDNVKKSGGKWVGCDNVKWASR